MFLLQVANRSEFLDEERPELISKMRGKSADVAQVRGRSCAYLADDPPDCPPPGDHRGRKFGARRAMRPPSSIC